VIAAIRSSGRPLRVASTIACRASPQVAEPREGRRHLRVLILREAEQQIGGPLVGIRDERVHRRDLHARLRRRQRAIDQLPRLRRARARERPDRLVRAGGVLAAEELFGEAHAFRRAGLDQLLHHAGLDARVRLRRREERRLHVVGGRSGQRVSPPRRRDPCSAGERGDERLARVLGADAAEHRRGTWLHRAGRRTARVR
jgi:hypothetical protein